MLRISLAPLRPSSSVDRSTVVAGRPSLLGVGDDAAHGRAADWMADHRTAGSHRSLPVRQAGVASAGGPATRNDAAQARENVAAPRERLVDKQRPSSAAFAFAMLTTWLQQKQMSEHVQQPHARNSIKTSPVGLCRPPTIERLVRPAQHAGIDQLKDWRRGGMISTSRRRASWSPRRYRHGACWWHEVWRCRGRCGPRPPGL